MGSAVRLNLKGCYNYKGPVYSSVTIWCAMSAELDLSTLQSFHFVVQAQRSISKAEVQSCCTVTQDRMFIEKGNKMTYWEFGT